MQIKLPILCPGGRPFALVSPFVSSHHEDLDRRLPVDSVVDTLEPAVEPSQFDGMGVNMRELPEIQIPEFLRRSMTPRTDDHLALQTHLCRLPLTADAGIAIQRALAHHVEPSAERVHRHRDVLQLCGYVDRLPIVVEVRVTDPLVVELRIAAQQ